MNSSFEKMNTNIDNGKIIEDNPKVEEDILNQKYENESFKLNDTETKDYICKDSDKEYVSYDSEKKLGEQETKQLEEMSLDSVAKYSIYNKKEQYFIASLCAMASFWSAISGNIYYPIIYTIQKKFHISQELANTSVVLYLVFQGISPMFFASIADLIGRRPMIIICSFIYIIACIAIAVSDRYGLILFFRCFQSAGISPVIAICSGISADLAPISTRGSLIGFTMGIFLTAQAFGACIGGVLESSFNTWRSVFWFLAIGCSVTFVVSIFLLPETKRSIVGNGSIKPTKFYNKAPIFLIPSYKKKLINDMSTLEPKSHLSLTRKLFDVPIMLSRPEVFFLLVPTSFFFASWTMMFTSLSTILQEKKGYSVFRVGLCFIAPGVSGCIGSVIFGRIFDKSYKIYNQKFQKKLSDWKATGIGKEPVFDIFKCRLIVLFPCCFPFVGGLIAVGWCLSENKPLVSILVSSVFVTFFNSPFVSLSVNIMADLYPSKTSTSSACVNMTRCLMAAFGVAALSKLESSLTVGGTFTLMAGFCTVSSFVLYYNMMNGYKWLLKTKEKDNRHFIKKSDV